MNTVYLNGSFMPADQARISPLDRGFLFADGVYEVVPAIGGDLFGLDEHLQRLERSMSAVRIGNAMSREAWAALARELITRNGGGDLSLYIQVSRGAPGKRDHAFPAATAQVAPTVYMATSPLSHSSIYDLDAAAGASAITREDIRWGRCDIKSVSLLPNVMFHQEAREAGAAEAILLRDGFVTEGTTTNVYVIKSGVVLTAPLSNRILGGVTRIFVLKLCHELGFLVEERDASEAELRSADEIWISSSTKDVLPIVTLDGVAVGASEPGPMWKLLAQRFVDFKHPNRESYSEQRTAASHTPRSPFN